MATKEPSKTSPDFVFKRLDLKNEPGDPQFLLLESDQQANLKLPAKLKNSPERIHSYLYN